MTEDQPSTGRLFRAASADEDAHTEAIPALPSDRAKVEDVLPDEAFRAPAAAAAPAAAMATPQHSTADAPQPEGAPSAGEAPVNAPSDSSPFTDQASPSAAVSSADAGLSTLLIWVIIVAATVIMGIADVIVRKQGIGWVTGVGLLAATIYAAIAARRATMWWSVIAAPIAIAVTILTVGQTSVRSGSFLLSQGLNLLDSLGRTAPFTIAAVVVAAVICFARNRRARRGQQP